MNVRTTPTQVPKDFVRKKPSLLKLVTKTTATIGLGVAMVVSGFAVGFVAKNPSVIDYFTKPNEGIGITQFHPL